MFRGAGGKLAGGERRHAGSGHAPVWVSQSIADDARTPSRRVDSGCEVVSPTRAESFR